MSDAPDIRGVDERLAWFLAHEPAAVGHCAEHVMNALGAPHQGYPDATAVCHKVQADGHMRSGTVPKGAILYWDEGSHGHGHTALSYDGHGSVASVDVAGPATVGVKHMLWFPATWPALRYRGWSWWWGGINTHEEVPDVAWTEGQDQVVEKKNVTVKAGGYVVVGRIDIPKPGSFLLTFQTRLPAGRWGRWQFVRDGWGADPDGRDQTGPNPLTPPDSAATSFTHSHRIEGGGPVDFEIKVHGAPGNVVLPYVICKAERIT